VKRLNRIHLGIIGAVIGGIVIAIAGIPLFNGETASDTDTLPIVKRAVGEASFATTDIEDVKDTVIFTIRGETLSVGDPIPWIDNAGYEHGAIPVEIKVHEIYKGNWDKEVFTIYLDSVNIEGVYYINPAEPFFEKGEKVIIHVAEDNNIDAKGIEHYYQVQLGIYGKYQVSEDEDKAYNEKYHDGVSVEFAANQAN